jgi:hypothetical protein
MTYQKHFVIRTPFPSVQGTAAKFRLSNAEVGEVKGLVAGILGLKKKAAGVHFKRKAMGARSFPKDVRVAAKRNSPMKKSATSKSRKRISIPRARRHRS